MRALLALFALFAAFACQPLCAAPIPGGPDILAARAADALAAMAGRKPAAEVFTADFLKAIPARQLARLSADLRRANGKAAGFDGLTVIAPTVARFRIRFERATAQASIQLEPWAPHRIAAFSISAVTPLGDSAEKILADFAALPARSGFAVVKLGDGGISPVLTLRPAGHLAIGSAFKLWVLDALAGEIEAGRLRWEQVVPLGPPSLPSGVTQNWPKDSPATIHTLATLMISISDNTATDTLIHLIGRERLEASVAATGHSEPALSRPFLTTAEVFALKAKPAEEAARFAASDEAEKRRVLATLPLGWTPGAGREAILASLATNRPLAIDRIEWFASPNDLAMVLDSLRRRKDPRIGDILGINPHVPESVLMRFAWIGYKGGSETGVISLNWLLRSKSGEWFAVAASWNDTEAPIDNARFELLAQRLIGLIR